MEAFPMKVASILVLLFALSACTASTPTTGPHATVQMRDGSSVSGMVLSSTSDEVKITTDDNVTRTIPMAQVRSIDYGDTPSSSAAAATPGAAPKMAGSAVTPAASAPRPIRPPLPHPTLDDITTDTHELPSGTEISVQTQETIDGSTAADGQIFVADVTDAVRDAEGKIVIPAGAKAQVTIKSLTQGGKIRGRDDLVLDLASVSIDGRQYALSTADLEQKGRQGLGTNKRTAEFVGGGAAIGSIVGAFLGGGKGAAIGAAAGAGGGTVAQAATKGNIRVEPETILTFKLDMPLKVVERRR
jgi:outer membrane lipoprotein SlyB